MAEIKTQKHISLTEKTDTIFYDFGMAQHTISPEETTTNQITASIEKTFIKRDLQGFLYSIKVSDRSQSNMDDLLGLEHLLAFLQKKIILYTNIHGEIISIVNRTQIIEDWYDQAKIIKKEYNELIPKMDEFIAGIKVLLEDDKRFVSFIKKSEVFSLLFPPIYSQGLMQKVSIKQNKKFDNFFDTTTLPITLDTTVTGINSLTNGTQLMRSGKLDTYRFDKELASELFTKAYGVHESALNFDISYLETFDFDKECQVDKANILLGVKVNDLYTLKQVSKLKQKEVKEVTHG